MHVLQLSEPWRGFVLPTKVRKWKVNNEIHDVTMIDMILLTSNSPQTAVRGILPILRCLSSPFNFWAICQCCHERDKCNFHVHATILSPSVVACVCRYIRILFLYQRLFFFFCLAQTFYQTLAWTVQQLQYLENRSPHI